MKLILLGAPGAGKGTQAEILSRELEIPIVSTGNILRKAIQEQTPLGVQASTYVASGALVPDVIVVGMLQDYLDKNGYVSGYILDGFPRNIQQAQTLDEMGIQIDGVINLCVDDGIVQQRLGGRNVCQNCGSSFHVINRPPIKMNVCDNCGGKLVIRKDDVPETLLERLRVYYAATEPLVAFYTAKGVLHVIDGNRPMKQITEDILSKLIYIAI